MTYDEFSKKRWEILEDCKVLIKELRLNEFNLKMKELIELQDEYLSYREKKDD